MRATSEQSLVHSSDIADDISAATLGRNPATLFTAATRSDNRSGSSATRFPLISTHATLTISLPWYDLPSTIAAQDAVWERLRDRLGQSGVVGLPEALCRDRPAAAQWQDERLALSQCCGLDLASATTVQLLPFARPVFGHLGIRPGDYVSHIVAADTASSHTIEKTPRVVVNGLTSHSGCSALLAWLLNRSIQPACLIVSGSHAASIQYLQDGKADVAAIDAHSWLLLRGADDTLSFAAARVRHLGTSVPAPTPPFVTALAMPIATHQLRSQLKGAFASVSATHVTDVLPATRDDYRDMAEQAQKLRNHFDLDRLSTPR